MRAFAVVAALSLFLAGCANTSEPEPEIEKEIEEVPFLASLVLVDDSRGVGEPSLGVAPDGTLFTNIGSFVYRSDDGINWTDLGDPATPLPNNDPDLAVDIDGTVWESRLYALLCNEVSVSRDRGETWNTAPVVCNGPVGDRQYVVPTENGEAFLYWHQLPTFKQTVMRTTDYGQTWLPTGLGEDATNQIFVTGSSGWGGGGFYNAATGSTYLTWTFNAGIVAGETAPAVAITRDGLLWEETHGPAFDGQGLGLSLVMGVADRAGNAYITWGENLDGDVAIFVSASQDDGQTWGPKIRVDEPDTGSHVFPAIAALDEGHVAIAYYENEDEGHPDNASGNWTVKVAWTTDFFADNATWNHGSMSNGETVKAAPICISGTTCQGGREFLDYMALKAMPDGRVAAAFNTMEYMTNGELRNMVAVTSEPLLASADIAPPTEME